ncbi:glycosyltransferase [Oscillochloris sp. ZM17-4]|uniref:glycosyltransferase n=1 Tax=Oscillochloris sp. ZM17-4 TaxID=2866714 RepID=UPI001C72E47D|nr:glycosyltransferase [Oscillochloris sp. ZM17-4]MBX0331145.1 glycosyltransferase [Oscillochloris sp. ZM17-4]
MTFLLILALAERAWKHLSVVRFFRRPPPPAPAGPLPMVSIIQPILSGDPALAEGLAQNLDAPTAYPREFLWLVDTDDAAAQAICAGLIAARPELSVRLILLGPPAANENPKLIKLIAGARAASGEVICVLDDDTRLPPYGLEQLLPALEQPGVGLAFGLPYYVSFDTIWSALVACFVNSSSLTTYLPFASLRQPLTINGMCYAMRRDVLARLGGFAGLEHVVADDFAVAQRVRAGGLRLAQTGLRHAIATTVDGPGAYARLIQRWLIFPRESLMRHLAPADLALFYAVTLVPLAGPWLALLGIWRGGPARALGLAHLLYSSIIFAHLEAAYLGRPTPRRWRWLVPLVGLLTPLQALAALLSPQRISWRGHLIAVEPGGGIRTIRRRA